MNPTDMEDSLYLCVTAIRCISQHLLTMFTSMDLLDHRRPDSNSQRDNYVDSFPCDCIQKSAYIQNSDRLEFVSNMISESSSSIEEQFKCSKCCSIMNDLSYPFESSSNGDYIDINKHFNLASKYNTRTPFSLTLKNMSPSRFQDKDKVSSVTRYCNGVMNKQNQVSQADCENLCGEYRQIKIGKDGDIKVEYVLGNSIKPQVFQSQYNMDDRCDSEGKYNHRDKSRRLSNDNEKDFNEVEHHIKSHSPTEISNPMRTKEDPYSNKNLGETDISAHLNEYDQNYSPQQLNSLRESKNPFSIRNKIYTTEEKSYSLRDYPYSLKSFKDNDGMNYLIKDDDGSQLTNENVYHSSNGRETDVSSRNSNVKHSPYGGNVARFSNNDDINQDHQTTDKNSVKKSLSRILSEPAALIIDGSIKHYLFVDELNRLSDSKEKLSKMASISNDRLEAPPNKESDYKNEDNDKRIHTSESHKDVIIKSGSVVSDNHKVHQMSEISTKDNDSYTNLEERSFNKNGSKNELNFKISQSDKNTKTDFIPKKTDSTNMNFDSNNESLNERLSKNKSAESQTTDEHSTLKDVQRKYQNKVTSTEKPNLHEKTTPRQNNLQTTDDITKLKESFIKETEQLADDLQAEDDYQPTIILPNSDNNSLEQTYPYKEYEKTENKESNKVILPIQSSTSKTSENNIKNVESGMVDISPSRLPTIIESQTSISTDSSNTRDVKYLNTKSNVSASNLSDNFNKQEQNKTEKMYSKQYNLDNDSDKMSKTYQTRNSFNDTLTAKKMEPKNNESFVNDSKRLSLELKNDLISIKMSFPLDDNDRRDNVKVETSNNDLEKTLNDKKSINEVSYPNRKTLSSKIKKVKEIDITLSQKYSHRNSLQKDFDDSKTKSFTTTSKVKDIDDKVKGKSKEFENRNERSDRKTEEMDNVSNPINRFKRKKPSKEFLQKENNDSKSKSVTTTSKLKNKNRENENKTKRYNQKPDDMENSPDVINKYQRTSSNKEYVPIEEDDNQTKFNGGTSRVVTVDNNQKDRGKELKNKNEKSSLKPEEKDSLSEMLKKVHNFDNKESIFKKGRNSDVIKSNSLNKTFNESENEDNTLRNPVQGSFFEGFKGSVNSGLIDNNILLANQKNVDDIEVNENELSNISAYKNTEENLDLHSLGPDLPSDNIDETRLKDHNSTLKKHLSHNPSSDGSTTYKITKQKKKCPMGRIESVIKQKIAKKGGSSEILDEQIISTFLDKHLDSRGSRNSSNIDNKSSPVTSLSHNTEIIKSRKLLIKPNNTLSTKCISTMRKQVLKKDFRYKRTQSSFKRLPKTSLNRIGRSFYTVDLLLSPSISDSEPELQQVSKSPKSEISIRPPEGDHDSSCDSDLMSCVIDESLTDKSNLHTKSNSVFIIPHTQFPKDSNLINPNTNCPSSELSQDNSFYINVFLFNSNVEHRKKLLQSKDELKSNHSNKTVTFDTKCTKYCNNENKNYSFKELSYNTSKKLLPMYQSITNIPIINSILDRSSKSNLFESKEKEIDEKFVDISVLLSDCPGQKDASDLTVSDRKSSQDSIFIEALLFSETQNDIVHCQEKTNKYKNIIDNGQKSLISCFSLNSNKTFPLN